MKKISFLAVVTNLLLACFVGVAGAMALPEQPIVGIAIGGSLFTASTIVPFTVYMVTGNKISWMPKGVALGAVQREIWVDYIVRNLFKDNEFMLKAFSEDQYVLAGKVVHIPQIGAKPVVVKNRSSYPATAVRRSDTDITYTLDEFTTDPQHIPNADLVEASYDMIDSTIGEHIGVLMDTVADELIYNWRVTAAGNMVRTSGDALAAHLDSATGNRKKFIWKDLKGAQLIMNKQNITKKERFSLVSSEMMSQLMDDADLLKRDYARELDMSNGTITRLFGFDLIERSDVLKYTNASTPVAKAVGAAAAATDNDAVLCWQKNAVARAKGEIDFFENLKDALYYGDVYSALIRMGGRKRRTNGEGVVTIIQASAA